MRRIVIFTTALTALSIVGCKDQIPPPTALYIEVPTYISESFVGGPPEPADNPTTVEGVALGRRLFYETLLSGDNTMSCASCHVQTDAFSDINQFSEGITGETGDRQAMAVINLAWDTEFFWDGRANSLEAQALGPVTNPIELNATWPDVVEKLQDHDEYPDLFNAAFETCEIDSMLVAKAIAQFERTLVSFESRYDKYFYLQEDVLTESELNGFNLFMGDAECVHCHAGPLLTDQTFKNNGLSATHIDLGLGAVTGDAAHNGLFKTTTLRNIALTAPYMHDGRFATLEEVVEHYNSGVQAASPNLDPDMDHFAEGLELTDQQKSDLVAFMHTLTDEIFVSNPAFSDPN